jgi:uncharacterized short protein YbdD (DUF466 family)
MSLRSLLQRGISVVVLEAGQAATTLRSISHVVCGAGDYDAYVRHRQAVHPNQPYLSREAFLRARQRARYGAGTARCC